MGVKVPRPLMQGMHEQGSNTGTLGDSLRSEYRVAEQRNTELHPLSLAIDREPGEHHDGHRIGHVAPNRAGCLLT